MTVFEYYIQTNEEYDVLRDLVFTLILEGPSDTDCFEPFNGEDVTLRCS